MPLSSVEKVLSVQQYTLAHLYMLNLVGYHKKTSHKAQTSMKAFDFFKVSDEARITFLKLLPVSLLSAFGNFISKVNMVQKKYIS